MAASAEEGDDYFQFFTFEGLVVAGVGVLCLVFVVLMCACNESVNLERAPDRQLQQKSEETEKRSEVRISEGDIRPKAVVLEAVNGDKTPVAAITPDHNSYQAPLTPPQVRSANTRVLPAPPITEHHAQHKHLAGAERAGATTIDETQQRRTIRKAELKSDNGLYDNIGPKPDNDLYDHLGLKPSTKPSDYDIVPEFKDPDKSNLNAKPSKVSDDDEDDDYSELEEKKIPVVIIDVSAKKTKLLNPSSKVKKADDFKSDYYSQVKEEDVYNNIGESDETVPAALVHDLKQSLELDDPYALVQDESVGEFKAVVNTGGAAREVDFRRINAVASNNLLNPSSILHKSGQNGEDYALVQKTKDRDTNTNQIGDSTSKERSDSTGSLGPPEPPRLYKISESAGAVSVVKAAPKPNKVHNYSKITARESMASISERKHRNLYSVAADEADNTYNTVEGWPDDGIEIDGATSVVDESRLSLISDTYAEIGISGESMGSILKNNAKETSEESNNKISNLSPLSSSVKPLSQTSSSLTASNGSFHGNAPFSSADEGSLISYVQEYENVDNGYTSFKTESYPPNLDRDKSTKISRVTNNLNAVGCVSENTVTKIVDDYPDYEVVDDTISGVTNGKDVANALQVNVDSLGNKKVGHRRHKLDP
jgi:hypothetical protein